jgi:hypothetical protein
MNRKRTGLISDLSFIFFGMWTLRGDILEENGAAMIFLVSGVFTLAEM